MFMLHGYEVFWPASYSTPVDFLARHKHQKAYLRVQVKTAHTDASGKFRVHTDNRKYDQDSFDVLAAVCHSGEVWLAPWDQVYSRKTLTLKNDMVPL
jgi:hypothetical protein